MKRILLLFGMIACWVGAKAQINLAPQATATASACNTGPCSTLNDLNFGTCGTQQMWIPTSSPPSSVIGTDFIEFTWPSVQAFDSLIIHHAQNNARSLTGFTIQVWDGTTWVTTETVSNLPQACINRVPIQKTFADRFRMTAFQMTGSGQTSNPNFREIEIMQASTAPNDAGVGSIDQSLTSSCPGTFPVFVNLQNFGTNQITTVDIEWEVNGVAQTPVTYSQLLDTAAGTGPSSALVNIGNITYAPQTNYVVKAWTTMPNMTADTANLNDTATATLALAAPQITSVTNVTATTAEVNFGAVPGITYQAIVVPQGNPSSSGTATPAVSSSPINLFGLNPSTAYDVYLFADCGSSTFSDTAGPEAFTTPIRGPRGVTCITGNPGVVYFEDFESAAPNLTGLGTGNGVWRLNSGGTSSSSTGPLGAHQGNQYMYYETSGSNPTSGSVVTGAVDLSTANDSAEMSFWLHAFGAQIGTLTVGVSTSASGPFTPVFTSSGAVQSAQGDPWQNVGVRLDAYVGQTIFIEFAYTSGTSFTGDIAIDQLEIRSCVLCPFPSSPAITALTDTNATVQFSDPSGSTWDLEWGPIGFQQGTGSVTSVTSDSVSFGPLSPNTCYDLYIRSNCTAANNGTSGWIGPLQFCTQCAAFTAPYSQNFDGTTAPDLDNCWTPLAFNPSATNFELQTDAFRNNSPSNSMELHNASATSGFLGIASPRFSDLDDQKRLEFFVYDEDGSFDGSDLIIGVMTNLADETTFIGLDTITAAEMDDDLWDFFVVDLTNNPITSGGGHVVFQHGMNSTFDNIHVDDFEYKQIPSCAPPLVTTLGVAGVTNVSATATWGSGSDGFKTRIAWGTPGFVPQVAGQLGIDSVAGTVDQYNITGLSPQTTYEFYVQDSCTTDGLSPWVGPFLFSTACSIFTAPFAEDFDGNSWIASGNNNNNVLDPCWTSDPDTTSTLVFKWIPRSTGPTSGNGPTSDKTGVNFLYCEASGAGTSDTAWLVTPYVDVSTLTVPALYFSQHRNANGGNLADMQVEVTNDFGATWTQIYSVTGEIQSAAGDPWEDEIIALGNYVGDTVAVRFVQASNGCCGDAAIDDVQFAEAPTCPDVINLAANNVVDTAATLSWVGNPATNSYEFWIGPQGFFQGTQVTAGSRTIVSNPNIVIDTLNANTCFDFVVRGICAPGDTGNWVGPFTFCTPCSPFPTPYAEDFDAVTATSGDFGNCWSGLPETTTTFSFRSNTGTTTSGSTGPNGDATSGSGVYLYTEASSGTTGNVAELYSPLFDLTGQTSPEVKFAYHMYGSTIDSLNLDINDGSGWTNLMFLQGQQQTASSDPWRDTAVDISSYSGLIQLRFRVTRGTSFTGDVSIDDVEVGEPIINDAEVNALLVEAGCGDSTTAVDVVFTNRGANAITSLPVSVAVSGSQTTTLNGVYTGNLATDQTDTLRVGTVNTYGGALLNFTATANLANDQVGLNDTISEGPVEFIPFEPVGFDTVACASDDSVFLRALDVGAQYAWFGSNSPTDTIPLATGDTVAFAAANALGTYFLQYQTGVSGSLTTTYAGGNGQAGNTFDVLPTSAISLSGMDIHIGGTTTENVSVYYRLGTAAGNSNTGQINNWTLHESFTGVVGAGIGNPTNLQFSSPLNLPGGQVSAILVVLTTSTNIDYTNGTTVGAVFASNSDLTIYEGFGIGWSAGNISGSFSPRNFNGALYYGSGGCSEIRTPVNVNLSNDTTEAAFTTTGTQPTFNFDASASVNADFYQWDFGDGNSGTGVTTSHTYANNGVYTVTLTTLDSTDCISQDTATETITVNVGIEENALSQSLDVYPNPTTNLVNIAFDQVGAGEVTLSLQDAQGRVVFKETQNLSGNKFSTQIDLSAYARGVYILEVESGDLKARRSVSLR